MEAGGRRYISHPSRKDKFRIWNIADIHTGNLACAEEKLKGDVKEIQEDPYSFWVGGGDYAEYIHYSDKRFDPSCIDQNTKDHLGMIGMAQAKHVKELLWPIKDKCLGMLFGNHEQKYAVGMNQESLHQWLCCEFGVENLGYCAFMDLVFVRLPGSKKPKLTRESLSATTPNGEGSRFKQRCFLHHGCGHAITRAGKMNKLQEMMRYFDADIYFAAHVHEQLGITDVQITTDEACTKLKDRVRVGVITGSYLKTYAQGITTYGEIKGYRPTLLGSVYVTIEPDKKEVRAGV